MKISIAVPTYECNGNGWLFLSELLNSISKQTYKNYEVVIADQSIDDDIRKIVEAYSSHMDIKYVNTRNVPRKIADNFNQAINNCSGDVIKPMCSDDFFVDDHALEKIIFHFKDRNVNWLVSGCVHSNSIHHFYDRMIPYYHDKIHLGANTISSPSVLSMREKLNFDENLLLLIDCEMYKRLHTLYGMPVIVPDPLISNRMHDNQMQKVYNYDLKKIEQDYCISLYGE